MLQIRLDYLKKEEIEPISQENNHSVAEQRINILDDVQKKINKEGVQEAQLADSSNVTETQDEKSSCGPNNSVECDSISVPKENQCDDVHFSQRINNDTSDQQNIAIHQMRKIDYIRKIDQIRKISQNNEDVQSMREHVQCMRNDETNSPEDTSISESFILKGRFLT